MPTVVDQDGDEGAFRELLRERLERVDNKLNKIDARISELQGRRHDLTTERGHLAALLGPDPASQSETTHSAAVTEAEPSDPSSIADRVVALLDELGRPLHYREIERELRARGQFSGGGQDPANTLLSRYFADPRLYRPKRGTYDLRERDTGARSIGTRRRTR